MLTPYRRIWQAFLNKIFAIKIEPYLRGLEDKLPTGLYRTAEISADMLLAFPISSINLKIA